MVERGLDFFRRFFSIKEIHLQRLRSKWGRFTDTYRDRKEMAKLYELHPTTGSTNCIEDATWSDLELDTLFDRLDNTATLIGRQYLFRQLRTFAHQPECLDNQYRAAQYFRHHQAERESVQLNMWPLHSGNSGALTRMLYGELPDGEFPQYLAWLLALTSITALCIALVVPALFWLPIMAMIANFFYSEAYAHKIGRHSMSFTYLKSLLVVAQRLTKINIDSDISQVEYLQNNVQKLRHLQNQFRIVGMDSTSANLITAQIAYFLNIICLFDFLVFMRCANRLQQHKPQLVEIYSAVASLDCAIALGSYLEAVGQHCRPAFVPDVKINFKQIAHPLLDNPVPNDYSTEGVSAVITGSNMAGKSTFIKTIGINLVLGQTFGICHAERAVIPKLPVVTSIKHTDSLKHGKSYYFTEIESLLQLVKMQGTGASHVFLIDEILHGTNTIERIASATAILEVLAKNNIVLVTTHDIELAQLLSDTYQSFHFQETSEIDNLFDYQIKTGHSTTRNAIALLEGLGMPTEVIERAKLVALQLEA